MVFCIIYMYFIFFIRFNVVFLFLFCCYFEIFGQFILRVIMFVFLIGCELFEGREFLVQRFCLFFSIYRGRYIVCNVCGIIICRFGFDFEVGLVRFFLFRSSMFDGSSRVVYGEIQIRNQYKKSRFEGRDERGAKQGVSIEKGVAFRDYSVVGLIKGLILECLSVE